METCKACGAGFHGHCDDLGPGQPCQCQQCPSEENRRRRETVSRRIRRLRSQLRAAEAEMAELTGLPEPEPVYPKDELEHYRRKGDRAMGRRRLELVTEEVYGT